MTTIARNRCIILPLFHIAGRLQTPNLIGMSNSLLILMRRSPTRILLGVLSPPNDGRVSSCSLRSEVKLAGIPQNHLKNSDILRIFSAAWTPTQDVAPPTGSTKKRKPTKKRKVAYGKGGIMAGTYATIVLLHSDAFVHLCFDCQYRVILLFWRTGKITFDCIRFYRQNERKPAK